MCRFEKNYRRHFREKERRIGETQAPFFFPEVSIAYELYSQRLANECFGGNNFELIERG
jgi:hypothetical protein